MVVNMVTSSDFPLFQYCLSMLSYIDSGFELYLFKLNSCILGSSWGFFELFCTALQVVLKKGKWNNIIFNIYVQQLSSHLEPVNGDCEAYEAPCPFHTIGCQDEEVGPVNACYLTLEKPIFFLPQYC